MSDKFKFEKLPGEPIVVFTAFESYRMAQDAQLSVEATFEFFDALDEPTNYILNWLDLNPLDIEDVSVGAMAVALAENPIFKHPKMRKIIFVTTSEIFILAARGLDSDTYGHIKIDVFPTLDEALQYARQ
ncbi:MAG: hypothetical protein JXA10_07345 [Anaerolineae bacterium]|nr:hypothetical protein [Anaerolineae bacterium]